MKGKKTYLVALIMGLIALGDGLSQLGPNLTWKELKGSLFAILIAGGLAALRAGVAKLAPVVLLCLVLTAGCGSTTGMTIPATAQGAQLLSGLQGQATEQNTATLRTDPHQTVILLFGKSKVNVQPDGTVVAESEGSEKFADTLTISPAVTVGDIGDSKNSSGGGGSGAAGQNSGAAGGE